MLSTWALHEAPANVSSQIAKKLADHRLDYLSYEGPVADNRGVVSRWDEGRYTIQERAADLLIVEFSGRKLACPSRLVRLAGTEDLWRITFISPVPTDRQ